MSSEPGVVTLSLDTELAWGCFDTSGVESHDTAYVNTRPIVERLCDLFGKYDFSATWGLVAHLLEDCRTSDDAHIDMIEPEFDWIDNWTDSLPCQIGVRDELWYAPDILETIRDCTSEQEIALHGYSHMVLDEEDCNPEAARKEIERAVAAVKATGISAESFIYPRNRIGYRQVLREHGIGAYRSPNLDWYERMQLPVTAKKTARFIDELRAATPLVGTPESVDGLVAVPGSQAFRPYHGGWQYTPKHSQVTRARKGIKRAAETGEIFHLWFHPFNIALEPDRLIAALEAVLQSVSEKREEGRIEVLTMGDIAREYRNGRWGGP